jgi:stage V sporulation protein S
MPTTGAETILTVGATSNPKSVAGAITHQVKEYGKATVRAIGERAVNQTNKALAIARGQLVQCNVDAVFVLGFVDVKINDEKRTALQYSVGPR